MRIIETISSLKNYIRNIINAFIPGFFQEQKGLRITVKRSSKNRKSDSGKPEANGREPVFMQVSYRKTQYPAEAS
ncbi:MAG: hypothetical protein WBA74_21785 [Cyclobacteriaceae bacterium]